jgi:hypothetical protein
MQRGPQVVDRVEVRAGVKHRRPQAQALGLRERRYP